MLRVDKFHIAAGIIVVAALALRLNGAAIYPLKAQHDAGHHLDYVRDLYEGKFSENYEGPYYYSMAAGFAHLGQGLLCWGRGECFETPPLEVAAALANLTLYLLYLAGIFLLGRLLSLKPASLLVLLGFSAASPVIHRSFNMIRPENFMLTCGVWALVLLALYYSELPLWIRRFSMLAPLLLALVVAQKISGAAFFAAVLVVLTFLELRKGSSFRRGLKGVSLFLLPAIIITGLLWFFHYKISGSLFYKHHYKCRDCAPESPLPFIRFNPVRAWENPFRNAHFDAAPNILTIDLFGDYWKYGFDSTHIRVGDKSFRLWRARGGLLLSFLFWLLAASGIVVCASVAVRNIRSQTALLLSYLSLPLCGYAFLIAASYVAHYGVHKFDIMKWEYILWGVPFLCFPVFGAIENASTRMRWLWFSGSSLVIAGGFIQSIILRWEI